MGAVAFGSPGSGSFNVPSVVQRAWVSCVGGGGGGSRRIDGLNNATAAGGGGGGWANGARNVSSTSISYIVGGGAGQGGTGGTSACLGVSAGGGGGGSGRNGGAGGSVSPSGTPGTAGQGGNFMAGGAAGSATHSPDTNTCFRFSSTQPVYGKAGNGGTGAAITGGTGSPGGAGSIRFGCGDPVGGNGGAYGGGGGGAWGVGGGTNPRAGSGAGGAVYVSWIDMSAGKTTLKSNEPTTVTWNSPVINGSQQVSYTNTGTTNITRIFTVSDSRGAQSSITFTITPQVRIGSFTASPNPQTSGFDGTPNFDVTLNWSLSGATSFNVRDNTGATIATSGTSRTVTNLPQSTGTSNCSNPGASRSYTLTATDGFNTVSSSLTVTVFNDNTPNNFSVPNRTGLEPDTFYITNIGAINGIDMATNVVGGPGVTVSKNNLGNFTSSTTITCNNSVQIRFRSDPFNKDPNGLPTAPKTLYVDIGPLRRFFTISTRAPIVKEIFDFQNENNRVPFPDIDTILTAPDHPAQQFIVSTTLSVDDVELQNPDGVEIRTNNGNAQVRKRIPGSSDWGPWQDVRSI